MDKALFLSLIGFAVIAAFTPGPNNLLLMTSGALFGLKRTVPHLVGILFGVASVVTAAVFGLGTVVARWPWTLTSIKALGAAWLAWLSLRFFKAAISSNTARQETQRPATSRPFRFHEGLLFQWVNPKGLVASLSSAGAYIAIAEHTWQRAVILVSVFLVTGFAACSTWLVAGTTLKRFMSEGRAAPYVNATMGLLILLTAIYILLS